VLKICQKRMYNVGYAPINFLISTKFLLLFNYNTGYIRKLSHQHQCHGACRAIWLSVSTIWDHCKICFKIFNMLPTQHSQCHYSEGSRLIRRSRSCCSTLAYTMLTVFKIISYFYILCNTFLWTHFCQPVSVAEMYVSVAGYWFQESA